MNAEQPPEPPYHLLLEADEIGVVDIDQPLGLMQCIEFFP